MEEAVLNKTEVYYTGAICLSLTAEMFRIERDVFVKMLMQHSVSWNNLIDKSSQNYKTYDKSIRNMQRSNFKIIDKMQHDTMECFEINDEAGMS